MAPHLVPVLNHLDDRVAQGGKGPAKLSDNFLQALPALVVLVRNHHDQNHSQRYFYPWGVVGRMRPAEEDEQEGSEARRDR